jgi:hypothetical protein
MGLSVNLEHLDDKLFVLSMVLQCMIGVKAKIGTGGTVGPACRVYLLLEIDNLLTLPDEVAWAFLHALEILSQDVGEGFTIWMYTKNSAAIEDMNEDVKKQVGTRLVQRWITHICKSEKIIGE